MTASRPLPDCSSVTDQQLTKAINSHWPIKEGVATIPFGFSTAPFWKNVPIAFTHGIVGRTPPTSASEKTTQAMQTGVRIALDNWSKASNGTLKFVEHTKETMFSPGIFFYFAGSAAYIDKRKPGAGAYSISSYDMFGLLKNDYIFFPYDDAIWSGDYPLYREWIKNTVHHEIGHALGFEHLHEYPDMKEQLKKIPQGLFCSVMPYKQHITSNTSVCNSAISDCSESYATLPAALDERMVSIAYHPDLSNKRNFTPKYVFEQWFSITCISFGNSCVQQTISSFLSNLAIQKDKPFIPENVATLAADALVLGALIGTNFPVWVAGSFAASSAVKFIYPCVKNKLPEKMQTLLDNSSSMLMLSITLAYLQEEAMVPWFFNLLFSSLGHFGGQIVGEAIGYGCAQAVNWVPRKLISLCRQPAAEEKT